MMAGFVTGQRVRLADLGEFRNGVNFGKGKKGCGLGLINVKDIFRDSPKIDFESLDLVDLADSRGIENFFVEAGDLFFVRSSVKRDGIGFVAYSNKKNHDAVHCGFVIRFRPYKQKVDSRFLTYALRSHDNRERIRNLSGGAAITNISQESLCTLLLHIPLLPMQRRIAGVLSAYDELIENNQRRIRILETMTRALYREWFVEFRFPGHDKISRVASPLGDIPQGWEVTTLGTQLNLLESGKRPKGGIRNVEDGVPSIGAENINGIGRHDFANEKYIPRELFQEMRKGVVRDRDVAIYKDGAYIGKSSYFRDGFPHAECCVNEHVFLLHTDGIRFTQNALYLWLQEPDTVHAIRGKNANAAQPGINQQSVGSLKVFV